MKLAEILLLNGDEVPGVKECSLLIYGKMNYNGIQKLKSRLQKKVENLLLLDSGTEKREIGQDELDRYGIVIRRKTALFQILLSKTGSSLLLRTEIDEIIRLSKKYENYSTLVELLKFKKWMSGFREGEKIIWEINREILFYQRCNDALNKATDCYYLGVIRSDFTSKADKRSFQSFLRESIAELKEECLVTQSPIVSYYTKQLEIMFFESQGNAMETRNVCEELLQIVSGNKSVFRKTRVAIVYDYMASCDIRLDDFEEAINHAILAQKHFIKNTANYYTALEHEFYARFYQSDLSGSQKLNQLLLRSVKKETGDFRSAKYLFYQANVLFALGKHKEAHSLLNFKLQLSKDKQGWDLSIRILKIQALIEMNRFDEASLQVASLIKHAERSFVAEEIKPREKLIIRTLRLLDHEGFSGSRILPKLSRFGQLFAANKNYHWEPLSSELIPFEKWLQARYKPGSRRQTALAAND
jgi:tetratricopeptide (TPR) repeat protein